MSSSEEDSVTEDPKEDEEEGDQVEDQVEEEGEEEGDQVADQVEEEEGEDEAGVAKTEDDKADGVKSKKDKKTLTPGVVYLSRIPPFMRPRKVRHLLSQYGSIGRIYLQPEDPQVRKKRQRFKKNRRRNYTEGWVEFADKRVAKAVAMALNNTQIGGKKRYYYHDDIWNMKYLPKFHWSHLTEKIAYEQAASEQKLRLEMSQLRRETNRYLENLERSKQVSAIVERKTKRGEDVLEYTKRRFRQRKVVDHLPSSSTSLLGNPSAAPTQCSLPDTLLRKILPPHK